MRFSNFITECQDIAKTLDRQGIDYLSEHSERFWQTYCLMKTQLQVGQSVLSVGAGSAYVEMMLHRHLSVDVTVIDFPEAILAHQALYHAHRFQTHSLDLSREWDLPEQPLFDFVMSCEIVEHIPAPPQNHFAQLTRYLKSNGFLIVTTPNLARFMILWRLLTGKPISQKPELTFAPVGYHHEHIHRREYLTAEIHEALQATGLTVLTVGYTRNGRLTLTNPRHLMAMLLETINPRWKYTLIMIARKN